MSKKPTAKDQGVPEVYLGPGGRFRPGMDARYKSDLIASALGIESKDALMTFDPTDAKKRVTQRGWGKFLAEKRKALAAERKRREREGRS